MAFREKSAWVMVAALLVSGALYGQAVLSLSADLEGLVPPNLPLMVTYTIVLVGIAVVGHVVAGISSYREADGAMDEREHRIVERASHLSSYVLGAGVVLALGLYLFTQQGHLLFYLVFASLMLSNLAEYAVQILLFRRSV
jgi:uncharacterized membrane protein YidH (DUF202 family)